MDFLKKNGKFIQIGLLVIAIIGSFLPLVDISSSMYEGGSFFSALVGKMAVILMAMGIVTIIMDIVKKTDSTSKSIFGISGPSLIFLIISTITTINAAKSKVFISDAGVGIGFFVVLLPLILSLVIALLSMKNATPVVNTMVGGMPQQPVQPGMMNQPMNNGMQQPMPQQQYQQPVNNYPNNNMPNNNNFNQ